MGRIHVLESNIVDQIAAGEVIARPASVVKELIENSLDAGAMHIEVLVRDGGKRLIEVRDDGEGIAPNDMPLALASHATSKLLKPDDLFRIGTFGFRGEALASIGSVANVTLTSMVRGAETGRTISMEGGKLGEVRECAAKAGTYAHVENIFFNVPARRKFLKGSSTEIGHIGEAVTRLALAHPGVSFTLYHNDKKVFRAPGADDLRERVGQFFGQKFSENLIPTCEEAGNLRLEALLASPHETRSSNQNQYIYVNNRFLRDRVMLAAIAEAYREFLEPRRHAIVFCFIDMPPGDVDVNVHPTKIEVRYSRPNQIFNFVRGAIRDALQSAGLAVPFNVQRLQKPPQAVEQHTPRQRDIPSLRERMSPAVSGAAPQTGVRTERTDGPPAASEARADEIPPATYESATRQPVSEPEVLPSGDSFLQVHDSFIVVETGGGFEVIDQHALHERIIYEKLRRQHEERAVQSQQLLVPEAVELPPGRAAIALDNDDAFRSFGFDIELFGENTILIRSVPVALRRTEPVGFFRDLLDELVESGAAKGPVDPDKLLATIACKGAIKAGQRLTRGEIIALLTDRVALDDSYACPHGRPTTLSLTLDELKKHFHRR
ncbi:MAG: DNA mismatch repair endonuclease MutL [Planctomycetota bacterium]|nr:MAG: DNA mismatch repair endonuclease MutL [Planctomycetota bacterium]